jgi:hypothetical protein
MRFFAPTGQKDNTSGSVQFDDGEMDEDGYWGMLGKSSKRELMGKLFQNAFNLPRRLLWGRGRDSMGVDEPGTLILVRHGESLWNANKTFTGERMLRFCLISCHELVSHSCLLCSYKCIGWADPDLSPQGYREVEHAAR